MKGIANIFFTEKSPALMGLQTIFDIEKISYNLCGRNGKQGGSLADIFLGDTDYIPEEGRPGVFIAASANKFLEGYFKIEGRSQKQAKFIEIEINNGFLPAQVQQALNGYLTDMRLRLPAKEFLFINEKSRPGSGGYEVLAYFTHTNSPAVIKKGNIVWCLFDIGEVFYLLISESYINGAVLKRGGITSLPILHKFYYSAPDFIRKAVRRRLFDKLLARVDAQKLTDFRTEFPVDCAGFAVIQMLRALLLQTGIPLIAIKKLPAGYKAGAVFTHDIEPTVFAYKKGIIGLLNELKKHKVSSSIGLVAMWAKKLPSFIEHSRKNNNLEFHCQGLYHKGRIYGFSPGQLSERLSKAKSVLEGLLKREIPAYRSPRLNRSQDLIMAIEKAGYKYSSISVDADRENTHSFGGGVSLNFPFRPIVIHGRQVRKARFLEFPVTAPDCITPIFTGLSEEELRQMYLKKIKFIRDTGGFFVFLIHAGVFNQADCKLRHRLLNFVIGAVEGDGAIWKPGFHQAYEWWSLRENLCAGIDNDRIFIENNNQKKVSGISIEVATLDGSNELKVDNLPEASRVCIGRYASGGERAPEWSYS